MASALYSGSRGPGSRPGQVIVLCSWSRHFTLRVPPSPLRVSTVDCQGSLMKCWGVPLRWISFPFGGGGKESQYSMSLHRFGNRDKLQLGGSMGSSRDLTFFF